MNSVAPVVTVVLPCYNAHRHLGQTLESLRAQSFRDFEVIVVDDGSTDPTTLDFLKSLGDDIRVVHQENRGLPGARNTGFRVAQGEFVLPLDCDDWLEPDALERLHDALQSHPTTTFAFAHIQMEGEGRGVLAKNYNFFEQLFLNQLPYCLLMRKSAWREVGGYDETMRRGYEDWEFNIRLGASGYKGIAVPRPLFHYRIAQSGMLLATSNRLHGELWREIRSKHRSLYRPLTLFRAWMMWKKMPSTYPLWLYFPWLAAAVLLPSRAFLGLFRLLRRFAHGKRVTAAAATGRSAQ